MDFVDIIDRLLNEGIEITLKKIDGNVWYDLNTRMKSNLLISPTTNGEFKYSTRYVDGCEELDWDNLMQLAVKCLCGREYMAGDWHRLLEKEGLIETETVTRIVIK